MSHSYKKQIFVWFDTVSQHLGLTYWHRSTRRHYKAIQLRPYSSVRCRILYCPRSCEKSISYFIFDQFSIFQGDESIYRITLVFWNCWKQSSLSPKTWAAIFHDVSTERENVVQMKSSSGSCVIFDSYLWIYEVLVDSPRPISSINIHLLALGWLCCISDTV